MGLVEGVCADAQGSAGAVGFSPEPFTAGSAAPVSAGCRLTVAELALCNWVLASADVKSDNAFFSMPEGCWPVGEAVVAVPLAGVGCSVWLTLCCAADGPAGDRSKMPL